LTRRADSELATARAVGILRTTHNPGLLRREAMTEAAKAFDLPVRAVYAAVERAKKSNQ
jgi:hypothetical protein